MWVVLAISFIISNFLEDFCGEISRDSSPGGGGGLNKEITRKWPSRGQMGFMCPHVTFAGLYRVVQKRWRQVSRKAQAGYGHPGPAKPGWCFTKQ